MTRYSVIRTDRDKTFVDNPHAKESRTLMCRIVCPLVVMVVVAASAAFAQTPTGQINGTVYDASSASVPAAVIRVTNSEKGTERVTSSNEAGAYAVPALEPGLYHVSVEKQGFRGANRNAIELHVNSNLRLDFTLEPGSVTESVLVESSAPLLQTTEASLGAVVENKKIVDLPLNGRNPFGLIYLVPGAVQYQQQNLPGNNIPLSNFSINGGPAMFNEVLLDGIPNTSPQFNQYAVIPSIDAVQEFKVQTNNMSAEFGRTSGGVINVSMRSGTNHFHGVLYEFFRNNVLDSNHWFNNANGTRRAPFRFNQFGGSIGGPIQKNKTFFFTNYEALRRRTGRTILFSVPTAEQRRGDFSQTFARDGRLIQIADPATTRETSPGVFTRDLFPGNRIPANRFNPVTAKALEYWGQPNLAGDPLTKVNNYISTKSDAYDVNQINARVDRVMTSNNQMFARFSYDDNDVTPANVFDSAATPSSGPQTFPKMNAALSDTHVFNATMVGSFRLGFTRLRDHAVPYGVGFDSRSLGLPASFVNALPLQTFPAITVNEYSAANIGFGTSSLGPVAGALINNLSYSYSAQGDLSIVSDKHVLKLGGDYRLFRLHGFRPQLPSFAFGPDYTRGPSATVAGPDRGHGFASFLLGLPSSGSFQQLTTQDTQSYYFSSFAQDDYRVTRRLTLNLGIRVEGDSLRTDRFNRLTYLNFDTPSPLQVPGVKPIAGGLDFVGSGGNPRNQADRTWNLSPRFGFSFQAAPNTVVRGGYGWFYMPRTGWDFGNFGQTGFSQTTSYVGTSDGFTPIRSISDPYPDGFLQPTGSTLGLLTNLGGAITSIDRGQKNAYMQQWNVNVQQSLRGNMLIEVAYAGSKGTRLYQNLDFNQIPNEYLSLGNQLLASVPNPFFGRIPANQPLGRATVQAGQLLRPYPQFTSFTTVGSSSGSSNYHSVQVRVEKRLSHGLSLFGSFTGGKLIDDANPGRFLAAKTTFQDRNNRSLDRSLSAQEISRQLTVSYVYELPFGRGKALLSGSPRAVQLLAAGWQINGIHSLQTGAPLGLTTASSPTLGAVGAGALRPDNNGTSAKKSGPTVERLGEYFNTSVFSQPGPFRFGNTSRTLPDVRSPGTVNFDVSVLKNTRIREIFNLQLRFEAFNVFNNTNFFEPNAVFGSASFGVISNAGSARIMQIGAKLYF
jgi:hypothetical protein